VVGATGKADEVVPTRGTITAPLLVGVGLGACVAIIGASGVVVYRSALGRRPALSYVARLAALHELPAGELWR